MKNLKDLTPEECVKIASIVVPDVDWKFIQSKDEWDEFDLVEKECESEGQCRYIFQIDYRPEADLKLQSRFRFYENTYGYTIDTQKMKEIYKYLSR